MRRINYPNREPPGDEPVDGEVQDGEVRRRWVAEGAAPKERRRRGRLGRLLHLRPTPALRR